jgi:hypothetical protein
MPNASQVSFSDDRNDDFQKRALPILQRLAEPGAVLAIADAMDKAVVVREDGDGQTLRTAVIDNFLAQELVQRQWIECGKAGRISRYRINSAGRQALGRLVANTENQAGAVVGFAEAQSQFQGASPTRDIRPMRRSRYAVAESPLALLARRRSKDGDPFLTPQMLAAGERLLEDFELSRVTGAKGCDAADLAQDRVAAALAALGPGLADVTLRCCCHLEGLEMAERALGWSARSGKIVLRIALLQLVRFYEKTYDRQSMIG